MILAIAGLAVAGVGPTTRARADWVAEAAFDAIVIGRDVDGTPLQLCRMVTQAGSLVLGKLRAGTQQCTPLVAPAQPLTGRLETLRPSWARGAADASPTFGIDSDGKTALTICRASVGGGLHPGKKLATIDACAVPYGGQEHWVPSYEVLARPAPFAMEEVAGGVLRHDAVVGGYEADGTPLYLCLGRYEGGTHPGKTRRDWNACAVSWGGGEQWTSDYRVFVPVFRALDQDTERWPIARGNASDADPQGVCAIAYEGSTYVGSYAVRERKCMFTRGTERFDVFVDVGWLPFTTLRAPSASM